MSELKTLRDAGVHYDGRLHISDRAHIVFDFHQQIDALNESRLGGKKLGTTHKGSKFVLNAEQSSAEQSRGCND
jgi:adenylosuccinate synthase